jgi:uncharacterized protein YybS (DUF2232 family)
MFGYSLFRLSLFIALAIIACTASGLITYFVSQPWLNKAGICEKYVK